MKVAFVLLLVIGAAMAQILRQQEEPAVRIVKQIDERNEDGSFYWAYENSDGTTADQKGSFRNRGTENEILVLEGSYTYYDSDAKLIKVRYIADENGFVILDDNRRVL
jgi:hypothetical protein